MPRKTELQKVYRHLEVEVEAMTRENNFPFHSVGTQSLLNPAGEDTALENLSLEALVGYSFGWYYFCY